ncbi:MAG: GNAT family N-acetyltransferase [Chloroflexia bacterium]
MSEEQSGLVEGRVLRIRPARWDDLDRLLWGGEHLRANRQRHLDRKARGEVLVLLPTLDDEPIGHLAMDLVRLRDEGGVYLYWFEVRDEFTRKGVGSAVVRHAERSAQDAGRTFAEIEVEKTNEGARRLYERLGYSLVGERLDPGSPTCRTDDESRWSKTAGYCASRCALKPCRAREQTRREAEYSLAVGSCGWS